jgi:hypothetical protein
MRQAAVEQLEVALELQIVGEVELADPGGIAAAAQVFEQQGVIQLSSLRCGQADFAADRHADPGAAHAVAFGLALGHVERVTEGAHQFGEFEIFHAGSIEARDFPSLLCCTT